MVKAQDLRIGNLVLKDSKPFRIEILHISHTMNDIYPIPLSEEILIKAGFKEIYQSDFSVKLELEKNIDFEAVRRNGNDWQIRYKGIVIPHVIYLHQLMNLFHSLCGKELEIEL